MGVVDCHGLWPFFEYLALLLACVRKARSFAIANGQNENQ